MKTSLLVIVTTDPRQSARPAEAIRIAAGIGAWKKVDVSVYLQGPAALALSEFPDELKDEDHFTRYLPIIRDFGRPVFVDAGNPWLQELGEAAVRYEAIDVPALARMSGQSTYVMRF